MSNYELLDFGNGRRLERFGRKIFDRICPAAENERKTDPELWKKADFCFVPDLKLRQAAKNSERGRWIPNPPEPFDLSFGSFRMELRATPFGHLGVFPEQQENWKRITRQLENTPKTSETVQVLNLFAYTGGSSLAAAVAGPNIEVVHVDSAKSVVDWSRRNAELNGIGTDEKKGRIRFIVEDARKFVSRELKRNNRYDAVILDPPTYGHGVKGESWKLAEDLPDLLADLISLLSEHSFFFLLTAHTPGFHVKQLCRMLGEAGLPAHFKLNPISMDISINKGGDPKNQKLPSGCGVFVLRQTESEM